MKHKLINMFLVLLTLGLTLGLYNQLPEMVPVHWNMYGKIDGYQAKEIAVWSMPGMLVAVWVMFQVLPKLDPKKEKYKQFWPEWQTLQTLILGFLAYTIILLMVAAINPGLELVSWLFGGMGVMFVVMGNLLPKVRQNYFVGIKVPWTLASEDNWNRTHRFGGWCFVLVGGMYLLQAVFRGIRPEWMMGITMGLILLPILYSGWLYKKQS